MIPCPVKNIFNNKGAHCRVQTSDNGKTEKSASTEVYIPYTSIFMLNQILGDQRNLISASKTHARGVGSIKVTQET